MIRIGPDFTLLNVRVVVIEADRCDIYLAKIR